jgi:Collagen triple helix repeat (20 copies)
MSENTPFRELAVESSRQGRDPKTRRILLILLILWLLTLVGFLGLAWNAYFTQKAATQSLAAHIAKACKDDNFGPGMSNTEEKNLCAKAKEEVDNNSITLGVQGPQGPRGPQGPQGIPGIQGPMGFQGLIGLNGKNGKNGLDGKEGLAGAVGPTGPAGSQGEKGDPGATGDTGPSGTSAVPFTFIFTVPGNGLSPGTTFSCTITSPDTSVTCQEVK